MLHWRLLHITILSLGSIATSAWAADAPLCPSLPQPDQNSGRGQSAAQKAASQAKPAEKGKPGSPAAKPSLKESKPGLDDGKIDIESDHAAMGVDGNGKLKGHVVVRQGDRQVTADEVEYNSKANSFKTDSGIQYDDPVMQVTGNGGTYSPTTGADFRSGTFELKQRAARGSAESLKLTPQGVIDLKGVEFTTCPKTDEAWQIRASSIKLDTTTRVMEARSATVDFQGVPIFYMPWMSLPLSNERKSGFLFPTIGNNSRSGVSLAVPYYWNIAPNADFTFEPIEYSKRGPDLGGEARYLSSFDHGELTWNYLPYDNVHRDERNRVKLTNVMELPDNFRFTVHAEDVSDTGYFEDFAQGPEGTSTAFIPQQALVTYRDEHWKVDAQVKRYQTTDITLLDFERPYARLPSIGASADFALGSADQLRYGFESEVVNFHRPVVPLASSCHPFTSGPSQCITGWRIDATPEASLNFDAPGYFIRPGIAFRATQYELEDSDPNTDPRRDRLEKEDPRRTLPIASFDTGLIFDREAGSHNQRIITLEPRLMYLYVPYRNQDHLPLFDTALPDLDPVELFRNNRYVGADRVGDANQISLGVTSRLLDARDGRQFLSATFGQIYYFSNPRVLLPNQLAPIDALYASIPGEVPRTDNRSDFVAQIALTAFQDWSADLGLQWDPQNSQSQRSQVNIQYKPSGQAVVNVGYRYQRDLLEQAEVSGAWPVSDAWNVFARGVYSLKDDEWLERFAGFEYRSCCWKVRLGVHSFVSNRNGASDTGELFQFELSGLAGVGSESDQFLTTAIRGYVPPATALKSQGAVRP